MTEAKQPEDPAYPEALRRREQQLIARRRGEPRASCAARTGLALSGGGIRSATFSLGFLQAIARRDALGEIDILSTVSGGGYTGGMLTRLFSRDEVGQVEDVKRLPKAILPESAERPRPNRRGTSDPNEAGGHDTGIEAGTVLRWLRENGHHLAPSGAGDLLLGGSVIFRNWLSVHTVLATLLLALFVAMQALSWALDHLAVKTPACNPDPAGVSSLSSWLTCHIPLGGSPMWWSPWLVLPPLIFILWPAPCAVAYWLMPGRGSDTRQVAAAVLAVLVALAGASWLLADDHQFFGLGTPLALALACGVTVLAVIVYDSARQRVDDPQGRTSEPRRLDMSHRLSSWLKSGLVAFAALIGLALADSLGQTLYVLVVDPGGFLGAALTGVLGALAALAEGGRRLVVRFRGDNVPGRAGPSLRVVSTVVAVLVLTVLLVSINALSHALAWDFAYPRGVPEVLGTASIDHEVCKDGSASGPCVNAAVLDKVDCRVCTPAGERSLQRIAVYFLLFAALSLLFARAWRFLNDSTLQPLYRARIIRAYLGASNPKRIRKGRPAPVTKMIDGDDIPMDWDSPGPTDSVDRFDRGAPLHIVNVTINETDETKTGLQRNDRKGIGMAVGPAGISAGVRHHVVFPGGGSGQADSQVRTYPADGFRIFHYPTGPGNAGSLRYRGEPLTFGQWIGISGAAFSTGVGMRTSFGLSFLAGILNVRLGYWWDSGVRPDDRDVAAKGDGQGDAGGGEEASLETRQSFLRAALARVFPVQSYLLEELFAQFRGVARQRWNLSDGGHFENLGGYELIRRRVPLIVIVDAEGDPDYRFEGLATLIRKARTDFDAEIKFLDLEAIRRLRKDVSDNAADEADAKAECWNEFVGSLDMLRRGTWSEQQGPNAAVEGGAAFSSVDRTRRSRAHAALATVSYGGQCDASSLILYVKPTLMGTEPADLRNYHEVHPDFPQQTTKDQFFDEAQWESYRKLGETVGLRLLAKDGPFGPYESILQSSKTAG